jgi:uncharacterized protein YbaA (DUF1428 family)
MYVDGYVVPVPKDQAAAYKRMARACAKVWREHDALAVMECRGDDVKPGKWTSFPQAVKLKQGEEVWFSWIVYPSRRKRDAVNAAVMKDPRMARMMNPANPMPFDGKRMFWGGFKPEVSL